MSWRIHSCVDHGSSSHAQWDRTQNGQLFFGPTRILPVMHAVMMRACLLSLPTKGEKDCSGYIECLLQGSPVDVIGRLTMGSICEEISYRCIMNWPKWIYSHLQAYRQGRCRSGKGAPSTPNGGRSPWILFKGCTFGALHILNHTRAGTENASSKDQFEAIIGAVVQFVCAFATSVDELDPLAEKHGLAAAIGSHVTHNMLVIGIHTVLCKLSQTMHNNLNCHTTWSPYYPTILLVQPRSSRIQGRRHLIDIELSISAGNESSSLAVVCHANPSMINKLCGSHKSLHV